jgi:CheY-like chemotaxis protein
VQSLKAKNETFDTILLDFEMPVMNGPTAAKKIRALGCESCIVGITGNVLPEDLAFFEQCGAYRVCSKPVKMEALEGIWVEFGIHGKGTSFTSRGETTADSIEFGIHGKGTSSTSRGEATDGSTYIRDRDPWVHRSSLDALEEP